jgi:hypothetical protein
MQLIVVQATVTAIHQDCFKDTKTVLILIHQSMLLYDKIKASIALIAIKYICQKKK